LDALEDIWIANLGHSTIEEPGPNVEEAIIAEHWAITNKSLFQN
jgi:hypothetical protein